ncbi:hypothetical protein EU538_05470 [Candidatus Thorarchaeota archaeon]|nr:MAG: hypothetical protein EU538_05470 [Candidatus Thorarchaeota archaeon]
MEENERELLEFLQRIESDYPGLLIVVEGNRDEDILRDLGVQSEIIKTQAGRPRPELIDHIADEAQSERPILILTDFDREGREMARFIELELEIRKIQTLRRVRRRIRDLMSNLRCIEELVSLLKRRDFPGRPYL